MWGRGRQQGKSLPGGRGQGIIQEVTLCQSLAAYYKVFSKLPKLDHILAGSGGVAACFFLLHGCQGHFACIYPLQWGHLPVFQDGRLVISQHRPCGQPMGAKNVQGKDSRALHTWGTASVIELKRVWLLAAQQSQTLSTAFCCGDIEAKS